MALGIWFENYDKLPLRTRHLPQSEKFSSRAETSLSVWTDRRPDELVMTVKQVFKAAWHMQVVERVRRKAAIYGQDITSSSSAPGLDNGSSDEADSARCDDSLLHPYWPV